DLALRLVHQLDDGHVLEEIDLPAVLVEARLELARRPERALRCLQDGRLDGLDEDLLVDALLLRDLIEDLAEARLRGGCSCDRCHDNFSVYLFFLRFATHHLRPPRFFGCGESSNTKLASATSSSGASIGLLSTSTRTRPSGAASSKPRSTRCPSGAGRRSFTRARRPANLAKSAAVRSGRSSPGELTSTFY